MIVARTRQELSDARRTIGDDASLVPTMGALHAGHQGLLRAARASRAPLIATMFVNPKQFESSTDLAAYPRDEARDLEILTRAGVDVAFVPSEAEIYPDGFSTAVSVGPLGHMLEGADRPGHFDGVATVVTRLFNLTRPARAYFGQKDWQQTRVVRRLVDDLGFNLDLHTVGTVRGPDGLAVSSRNVQLGPDQRRSATTLWQALQTAQAAWAEGERDPRQLEDLLAAGPTANPDVELHYAAVRDALTLVAMSRARAPLAFLVAASVGGVRLIDNAVIGEGLIDDDPVTVG